MSNPSDDDWALIQQISAEQVTNLESGGGDWVCAINKIVPGVDGSVLGVKVGDSPATLGETNVIDDDIKLLVQNLAYCNGTWILLCKPYDSHDEYGAFYTTLSSGDNIAFAIYTADDPNGTWTRQDDVVAPYPNFDATVAYGDGTVVIYMFGGQLWTASSPTGTFTHTASIGGQGAGFPQRVIRYVNGAWFAVWSPIAVNSYMTLYTTDDGAASSWTQAATFDRLTVGGNPSYDAAIDFGWSSGLGYWLLRPRAIETSDDPDGTWVTSLGDTDLGLLPEDDGQFNALAVFDGVVAVSYTTGSGENFVASSAALDGPFSGVVSVEKDYDLPYLFQFVNDNGDWYGFDYDYELAGDKYSYWIVSPEGLGGEGWGVLLS